MKNTKKYYIAHVADMLAVPEPVLNFIRNNNLKCIFCTSSSKQEVFCLIFLDKKEITLFKIKYPMFNIISFYKKRVPNHTRILSRLFNDVENLFKKGMYVYKMKNINDIVSMNSYIFNYYLEQELGPDV